MREGLIQHYPVQFSSGLFYSYNINTQRLKNLHLTGIDLTQNLAHEGGHSCLTR